MADQDRTGVTDADNLSGSGLQQSQMTGAGGAGLTRDHMQGETGGPQLGGGPSESDMASPGGSSGSGGYGNDQQSANHQGQHYAREGRSGHDEGQSRGERFDEEQSGGRGTGSVSSEAVAQSGGGQGSFDQHTNASPMDSAADELLRDQQEHQDRGKSDAADFEADAES